MTRFFVAASPEERFSRFVEPDTNGGCWLWSGCVTGDGYGRFWLNGRMIGAHQFAFEEARGVAQPGKFVCHRCDTPPCVNPAHLFLGTPAENTADMIAKGRRFPSPGRRFEHGEGRSVTPPSGERHHRALLTEVAVAEIRLSKASHREVARKYGVSMRTIENVRQRITWKHVP